MMNKEERKQSILDKQMEMAMDGSIEMLKWLGINLCGQSNQPDVTDQPLPTGFDISVIPTRGQEEYEEYRDDFLAWKEGKDVTSI
jgi:hypothetical protein